MTRRTSNLWQSVALLGVLAVQAALVGWILGGAPGIVVAAVLGLLLAGGADRVSAWSVLRALRARRIPEAAAPGLHRAARTLAARAGLPRAPALAYIDSPVPNALTVGSRDEPVIGITRGLLRQLPDRELAGVLAHEIGHIAHGDLRVLAIARAYASITMWAGRVGWMLGLLGLVAGHAGVLSVGMVLVLGGPAATLVLLAVSRQRELAADGFAAELTGDPVGLAHALQRIESFGRRLASRMGARTPRAESDWLQSHPHTKARVRHLAGAS